MVHCHEPVLDNAISKVMRSQGSVQYSEHPTDGFWLQSRRGGIELRKERHLGLTHFADLLEKITAQSQLLGFKLDEK